MWLDKVKEHYGENLQLNWRNFSLQQINAKDPGEWRVWQEKDYTETRSLMASIAGEAAKRQGSALFNKFFLALLTERHGGARAPLNDQSFLVRLAEKCGLDVDKFQSDMEDEELVKIIAEDHTEATEVHGAFGTPTFIFDNGQSAYLKTFIPPEEESVSAFEHFLGLFENRPYIGEVKRPQPPWPKGAV
ncbi:DsbA family protein [Chloroflexi bacterium]|nr:DsbA family protein [Chloroflexota bacterium]